MASKIAVDHDVAKTRRREKPHDAIGLRTVRKVDLRNNPLVAARDRPRTCHGWRKAPDRIWQEHARMRRGVSVASAYRHRRSSSVPPGRSTRNHSAKADLGINQSPHQMTIDHGLVGCVRFKRLFRIAEDKADCASNLSILARARASMASENRGPCTLNPMSWRGARSHPCRSQRQDRTALTVAEMTAK